MYKGDSKRADKLLNSKASVESVLAVKTSGIAPSSGYTDSNNRWKPVTF